MSPAGHAATTSGAAPSAAQPFAPARDPLAWSAADKCLFVSGIFLIFTLCYTALFSYAQTHAEVAPYVDRDFLRWFLHALKLNIVAWTIVFVASLALRRLRPHSQALTAPTLILCGSELLYATYFFGLYTSLYSGLAMIASWAIGLVLFDRRAMRWAFVVVMSTLLAITLGEALGLFPYAPLFRTAPFHEGRLHLSFLVGMGGVTLLMMIVICALLYFVIERWHDREAKLAAASEQIARANDVISRYVASQLAEQVRTGDYTSLERHERRRLTLFFSDIEDFAEIADRMEPEDLSALLNDYLSEMTVIAERYGATIDKFVGDAIMIFFGAPAASSDRDQAVRAVRMAAEMQDHLSGLRETWLAQGVEKPFHVRIGINTGQASVGAFGSRTRLEYTAIGRQVNLAAFLQARCERDRILVSHSTWALIHEEVACTPKGEIALNGFHQPVKVYEVAEPTSPRTRVAHSPSDGRTEVDEELRARSARRRSSGGIA